MTAEEKLKKLVKEYYDQYKTADFMMTLITRYSTNEAIKVLENRNGAKIKQYFTDENIVDEYPNYVYE